MNAEAPRNVESESIENKVFDRLWSIVMSEDLEKIQDAGKIDDLMNFMLQELAKIPNFDLNDDLLDEMSVSPESPANNPWLTRNRRILGSSKIIRDTFVTWCKENNFPHKTASIELGSAEDVEVTDSAREAAEIAWKLFETYKAADLQRLSDADKASLRSFIEQELSKKEQSGLDISAFVTNPQNSSELLDLFDSWQNRKNQAESAAKKTAPELERDIGICKYTTKHFRADQLAMGLKHLLDATTQDAFDEISNTKLQETFLSILESTLYGAVIGDGHRPKKYTGDFSEFPAKTWQIAWLEWGNYLTKLAKEDPAALEEDSEAAVKKGARARIGGLWNKIRRKDDSLIGSVKRSAKDRAKKAIKQARAEQAREDDTVRMHREGVKGAQKRKAAQKPRVGSPVWRAEKQKENRNADRTERQKEITAQAAAEEALRAAGQHPDQLEEEQRAQLAADEMTAKGAADRAKREAEAQKKIDKLSKPFFDRGPVRRAVSGFFKEFGSEAVRFAVNGKKKS